MKYNFLVNPHSGSGKGQQIWQQLKAYLDEHQISYSVFHSEYAGHPRQLANQLATNHGQNECLVVVGGDGTLHEAVTGLIRADQDQPLPFAYIPAGTGNDFARGYGVSFRPLAALQQILTNQKPHPINIGHFIDHRRSNQGIFLNNFGIGFDAAIVNHTVDSKLKRVLNRLHLGTLSYAFKTVKILFSQHAFPVEVIQDGQKTSFNRAFLVVTSNHPYIGGGVKIAADQHIDQATLELAIMEKRHWVPFLWTILLFATGRLIYARHVHLFRGPQIRYRVLAREYGQIDGEVLGQEAFDLTLTCLSYPVWQTPLQK